MDNSKTHSLEKGIPLKIGLFVVKMNGAIQLDDEACLMTIEINNETGDNLLSSKMDIFELVISNFPPKQPLRPGHPSAESLCLCIF